VKVIYHHNCIDGFTAAWCAWRKFGNSAEYIPAQYNEPAPDVTAADVLILDFSYPRQKLIEMHGAAKSLRVLDHHKTAEADLAGLDFCTFDMNRSGAGLAFDELLKFSRDVVEGAVLVAYVEDRDLWRFALPHSKVINAYIGSFEFDFPTWSTLAEELDAIKDEFVNERGVLMSGEAILRKDERYVASMCKEARVVEFAGYYVPVVNAPYLNTSELVGKLAENQLFAVGWFQRGDGKYQSSLRSRGKYDVAALAESFGGGGHKNAAGFTVEQPVES
jgi:oligoribonuclease NrnB/cAMP/cGMP phosphodiesterase (DHH superfamily)